MSEHRLSQCEAKDFLDCMIPENVRYGSDTPFIQVLVGGFNFEVAFPDGAPGPIDYEIWETACDVMSKIIALDAIATSDVDGKIEDGELFSVLVLSLKEIDLWYSAVSWNSDWREMFERTAHGEWMHRGTRKHS